MKKKIIICEDDEDIVEMLRMVLEKEGNEVRVVRQCEQIWEKIMEQAPDVILMDLWVPGEGGEKVTRKLKAKKETKGIRIIIISGAKDAAITAADAGADACLGKPFNIHELKALINKC